MTILGRRILSVRRATSSSGQKEHYEFTRQRISVSIFYIQESLCIFQMTSKNENHLSAMFVICDSHGRPNFDVTMQFIWVSAFRLVGKKRFFVFTDTGPFECKICARVFTRKQGLSKHKTETHKITTKGAIKPKSLSSKSNRKEEGKELMNKHSENNRSAWSDVEESANEKK